MTENRIMACCRASVCRIYRN